MKLLPTPQVYTRGAGSAPLTGFARIVCEVPADDTIRWGLDQVRARFAGDAGPTLRLRRSGDAFFGEKNAAEQGYILRRAGDGVTLEARQSAGFL